MITAEGCKARRARLLDKLRPRDPLLLGDPLHLRYFAGCHIDPFSLGADFGAFLRIMPDGQTTLFHDHRLPKSVEASHVDDRLPIKWYDGKTPGQGPRRMILHDAVMLAGTNGRIHDALNDPLAPRIFALVHDLRRQKDPDEVETLKLCMRATEAGHAWARANVAAGMTELDVYAGVSHACTTAAGQPVIVYGDFAVSPGMARRGGMPTNQVLQNGDTLILDFSVIIAGYRSDFTNTLVVGGNPTPDQVQLFNTCVEALTAGEQTLRAGMKCLTVYQAIRSVFAKAGLADAFPHHAGHGIGISHPEAPYLVAGADETLLAGDVITLEPGLYFDNVGGIRIEHNYLITTTGYERLSQHEICLN